MFNLLYNIYLNVCSINTASTIHGLHQQRPMLMDFYQVRHVYIIALISSLCISIFISRLFEFSNGVILFVRHIFKEI